MRRREFLTAGGALLLAGCTRGATPRPTAAATTTTLRSSAAPPPPSPSPSPPPTPGTPEEIVARSTVPVLCFHQLRQFQDGDSAYARTIITPPDVFAAQMQAVHDGGYIPVPASDLVDHLQLGTPLPDRAVLLSFDDGSATHATVALPVLQRLGFPAIFFPMTVVLDKPNWLSREQLHELEGAGMTIGAHTWDHQRLDRVSGDQWAQEVDQPGAELAEILGHPVDLLAYPYGVWSQATLDHVAAAGYRAAFQLAEAQDPARPLLTIRRVMPPPTWDGPTLLSQLDADF